MDTLLARLQHHQHHGQIFIAQPSALEKRTMDRYHGLIIPRRRQFTGFDMAANMVRKQGVNCLLLKIDIKHAVRVLPILKATWWVSQENPRQKLIIRLRKMPSGIYICTTIATISKMQKFFFLVTQFWLVMSIATSLYGASTIQLVILHRYSTIEVVKFDRHKTTLVDFQISLKIFKRLPLWLVMMEIG